MPRPTRALPGAVLRGMVMAIGVLAAVAATATLWSILPSSGPGGLGAHAVAGQLSIVHDVGDVAGSSASDAVLPARAVPARVAMVERSGPAESARAWAGPQVVTPILAMVAICLVAGSAGRVGRGRGRSSSHLGRAPPLGVSIRSVR